jgi:hypothetical protein
MIKLPVKVRVEQAVYGSFPFWNRGYGVLAGSAGCRPEWLAELRIACQRYGEPPTGTAQADGLFALPLQSGPWMIVGVHPLGCDDRDRPGALAFHALFIRRWAYWWAGSNPFAFAGAIGRDWCAADQGRCLPSGCWPVRRTNRGASLPNPAETNGDQRLPLIVTALTRGRRVLVQASEPIDALARDVWRALPRHVRRQASTATWAFDNANQFDLVALPKLPRVPVDATDLILTLEHAGR